MLSAMVQPFSRRCLLRSAIADGGRPGELPQLILLHASPGQEEAMLESIEAAGEQAACHSNRVAG